MYTETIVSLEDLRYLTIACGEKTCGTEILIDLNGSEFNIVTCPTCHEKFDPDLNRHLGDLSKVYKYRKTKLSFRVSEKKN